MTIEEAKKYLTYGDHGDIAEKCGLPRKQGRNYVTQVLAGRIKTGENRKAVLTATFQLVADRAKENI